MITRRTLLASFILQDAPVRVVCGGDVLLARSVGRRARESDDWLRPLRGVAPALLGADLAFVNLESPFSETGPYEEGRMVFRARPELVEALSSAGVNVVSLANNHVRDAGPEGLAFTLKLLEKHSITASGVGGDAVVERRGQRFQFLAYTYDQRNGNWETDDARVAPLDPVRLKREVTEARRRGEIPIVSMHAGAEYKTSANAAQRRFAETAAAAGAACVVGHHPHVVQEVEEIGGVPVFFSLGNLVFDQKDPGTNEGLLAEMLIEGGRVIRWRTLPTVIEDGAARLLHKYEEFR